MFLKIFTIVCFATLVTFVHSDDDLLTLTCHSCLSFDQEPTTAGCSYMNCTDLAATENFPVQYAVCVKTKIQYQTSIVYQASCEYQILTLQDQKYCADLEVTDVPGMKFLECKSCRNNLCNSY
ncbi:unnamed protein product [Ceutorhynchus assimilis]|uniref:Uncharacterized protein n=1 Tax=Ceutorhynchus assimilis TaxID=467358 RepID=A0A9N9MTS5_9CUCU|nr:unnamed protein product [Ceutorhynchus assimilis]